MRFNRIIHPKNVEHHVSILPPNILPPQKRSIMTRNQKIAEFKKKNPCVTLAEIGKHYGISAERVRQIIKKATGKGCGQMTKPRPLCLNCGLPCKQLAHIYCSRKCYNEARLVTMECYTCGKLFTRRQSQVIRAATNPRYTTKRYYCSTHCSGVQLGREHGWGTRGTRHNTEKNGCRKE